MLKDSIILRIFSLSPPRRATSDSKPSWASHRDDSICWPYGDSIQWLIDLAEVEHLAQSKQSHTNRKKIWSWQAGNY